MRQLLFALMACFALLTGCSKSPQEKAEDLVKQYLKENLHDPASYDPVEFSKLDSLFVQHAGEVCSEATLLASKAKEFDNVREKYYNELQAQSDTITEEYRKSDEFQNKIANAQTYLLGLIDSAKVYNDKAAMSQLKFSMKGKFGGYTIEHKYRANNKMGAKVLGTDVFNIDSTLTKVIDYHAKE